MALGYNGVKDYGTFKIDSTTAAAIGTDFNGEVGKVYTISGDGTVGYGLEGDPVFGVVERVEKEKNNSTTLLAVLKLTGLVEGVAITETAAKQPSAGDGLAVDGAGALVKLTSYAVADNEATVIPVKAIAFSVDTTAGTAVIQLF